MRRTLIATTALALSLLGTGAAAAAESPSPSPSLSASEAPEVDASTSPSVAPEPSPVSPSPSVAPKPSPEQDDDDLAREPVLALAPTFTCDTDPTDDFVVPEDSESVTYTLADGVLTVTLNDGYEWGWGGWDPWRDPTFEDPYIWGDPGTTETLEIVVEDLAFPNCTHDDETQVTLATECRDGMGYLVYEIDAPWANDETHISLYPFTADEAAGGYGVYDGTGLSGRLAWDGSTPGMTGPIDLRFGNGSPVDPKEKVVYDPIFMLSHEDPSGSGRHRALAKVDFQAVDPCPGGSSSDGGSTDGGDGTSGEGTPAGSDDDVLAATGPEAALLTTGVAALLIAAGATLLVARRRLRG